MAAGKKFGTFAGVFTPSLLTILGVIMYMRMGWVVGNAGLIGTIIIVVIAHVISITTGLSISSIATDKKIGAGGVYYVLSRSLGLPIGGAIGLTLFAGTALSIALYLVGFAESINAYLGFDTSVNGLRITGTIALLALAAIALISTAVALKAQFFILAAIVISLVAIFFGQSDFVPITVPFFGGEGAVPMEQIFAVFFPAVTGFTAGIAMSGDLRDSKKSIPAGTIAAIAVGFIVYVGLAIFISYRIDASVLVADNNILMKVSLFAPAVVAGIWGATLSSALGGILGGPRILQAMSVDRITPKFFGRGRGKDNEPWNALFLTVIIAECGILIGELDMIARVVSMFYLAAYGFINISFYLESWASADFKPSFRVKRWIGLLGFIATFAVMFKLDMLAMIAAFVVIGGVYAWLQSRELALGTGDIWQSVWSSVVKTGLRKMAAKTDHKRNWKPNILLFSGATDDRPHMLEFSKSLAGRSGVVTNFHLLEDPDAKLLFTKAEQAFSDEVLERFDIFGRRIHVQNIFKGIEGIASTFGFSGIEPNTVLMGWPRGTKDPIWFAEMTRKLIDLDYNVLYLDYDERRGFGKRETVDLWWRGIGDNAELTLNLARFVTSSPDWKNAKVRVLLVNEKNVESKLLRIRAAQVLETFRMEAEVQVINNSTEMKSFYELVKVHSADADLILTGIPEIAPDNVETFVADTTELVGVIGTTLLVKASSQFEQPVIAPTEEGSEPEEEQAEVLVQSLQLPQDHALADVISNLDRRLEQAAGHFRMEALEPLSKARTRLVDQAGALLLGMHDKANDPMLFRPLEAFNHGLEELKTLFQKAHAEETAAMGVLLQGGIPNYLAQRQVIVSEVPEHVERVVESGYVQASPNGIPSIEKAKRAIRKRQRKTGKFTQRIAWKKILAARETIIGSDGVRNALLHLGMQEMLLTQRITADISQHIQATLTAVSNTERKETPQVLLQLRERAATLVEEHHTIAKGMAAHVHEQLRKADRDLCNGCAWTVERLDVEQQHADLNTKLRRKEAEAVALFNSRYAEHWTRNNGLLQQQVEVGVELARLTLRTEALSDNTLGLVKLHFLRGMQLHVKVLGNAIDQGKAALDQGELEKIEADSFQLDDDLFFSPEQLIEQLIEQADELLTGIPDEVLLLSAGSINTFSEEQGEGVEVERLALDRIVDHLMETLYIEPLQEKLVKLGRQLDRLSASVKSAAEVSRYAVARSNEDEENNGLELAFARSRTELDEAAEALDVSWQNFRAELAQDGAQLAESLEVRSIIEHAAALSARISVERRRRGAKEFVERVGSVIAAQLKRVQDLVQRRTQRVAMAGFDREHKAFENEHERVRDMMEQLSLSKTLEEKTPFHYQHLFGGKHYNVNRNLNNRSREMALAVRAVQRIREGASGGIMIVGEGLSGKTFFTEHIAKQLVGWNVVRVNAPAGGGTSRKDLTTAFQEATGSSFPLDRLLNTHRAGTAFILNDVEKWWSPNEDRQEAIEHLTRMIDRHGSKHFFLLNSNLHAFAVMQETSSLASSLLSTIVLTPLSLEEVSEELWLRHDAGGLDLLDGDDIVDDPDDRVVRTVIRKIHGVAKGNIGLSLRLWLAQINQVEGNGMRLGTPGVIEFPDLDNGNWKSLLLQFTLHHELSRERLLDLYRNEGRAWTDRQIQSMRRSGILDEISHHVYTLAPASRPFVEAWLKELRILN